MTVSELRKKLKGIPGHIEVYTADHDHGKYEWNAKVGRVDLCNQAEGDPWDIDRLDDNFKIKGKYLVIRP